MNKEQLPKTVNEFYAFLSNESNIKWIEEGSKILVKNEAMENQKSLQSPHKFKPNLTITFFNIFAHAHFLSILHQLSNQYITQPKLHFTIYSKSLFTRLNHLSQRIRVRRRRSISTFRLCIQLRHICFLYPRFVRWNKIMIALAHKDRKSVV